MVVFVCDGCGARVEMRCGLKPPKWYERTKSFEKEGPLGSDRGRTLSGYEKEEYHACSRECIELVAAKFGGHSCVLPI